VAVDEAGRDERAGEIVRRVDGEVVGQVVGGPDPGERLAVDDEGAASISPQPRSPARVTRRAIAPERLHGRRFWPRVSGPENRCMTDLSSPSRLALPRPVRAPRGTALTCRSWLTEAAYRMLQNNLDPEVAENPDALVVYGGIGKAARDWPSFEAILATLRTLGDDETLLVQSGKPVGVFRTHADAPRVLLANSNLVPKWATWEHFAELDRKGLMMYGQMTAGSWIYIGSQGIVQGTFETFVEAGRQHYGGSLQGRWILTAGLGGMGGAQPLAATFAGACSLVVECQQSRIDFRLRTRYVDEQASDLDDAIARIGRHTAAGAGAVRGPARQRRRGAAGARPARRPPRPRHRPDLGARSRQRLPARGLDGRALARGPG
jgi:hypothetical protein